MKCPDCGSDRTRVRRTISFGPMTSRQYRCECGIEWSTEETIRAQWRSKADHPCTPVDTGDHPCTPVAAKEEPLGDASKCHPCTPVDTGDHPCTPVDTGSKTGDLSLIVDLDLGSKRETTRRRSPRQPAAQTGEVLLGGWPCDGPEPTWDLRESTRTTIAAAYPTVDVLAEARKARAWLEANPARRKTASGMPRFLTSWVARAVNSGSAARLSTAPPHSKPRPNAALADDRCLFHRQTGNERRHSSEPAQRCPVCCALSWEGQPDVREQRDFTDSQSLVSELLATMGGDNGKPYERM